MPWLDLEWSGDVAATGEVRESQLLGEKDEAPEQMLMTAMDVLEATCATLVATRCNMVGIVDNAHS